MDKRVEEIRGRLREWERGAKKHWNAAADLKYTLARLERAEKVLEAARRQRDSLYNAGPFEFGNAVSATHAAVAEFEAGEKP